ncbi:glucosamine-6-phosphate deaminase [Agrococcus casei]|uniref:glucosamine-6-phosphate deaminase n=3 Tax=Agrococcus casei TaxID=343512 RepID=UPI003F8E0E8C
MSEVIIAKTADEAGAVVARRIADQIAASPSFVLGVATGSTPLTTYRALADLIRTESIAVDAVRAFALDEYVGLPAGHPEGYASVVAREVVRPLGLDPQLVRVPDGSAEADEASCADYEAAIREAGGVDLQLLGIGSTGHIGFNEPGSAFDSRTRVTELAESTRRDNARFFDSIDDVPTHAATQGIGTILEARQLVLLAFGESKAQAVARAVEGPVTEDVPASALQLHPHATIVIDEAAASLLQGR